jgi:hypothetical protein
VLTIRKNKKRDSQVPTHQARARGPWYKEHRSFLSHTTAHNRFVVNLFVARHLAITLMARHGLAGWRFAFDHARRRFGSCQFGRKTITLSRYLTILHEIAHALCPHDGHGAAWKAMCRRIGAKPERCYQNGEVVTPPRRPAPWKIGCPRCGWWTDRHKRTSRKLVCRTCRSEVVYRSTQPDTLAG